MHVYKKKIMKTQIIWANFSPSYSKSTGRLEEDCHNMN